MRPSFVVLVLAVFVTSVAAQKITGDVTGRVSPGTRIEVRSVDGSTLVAATTAARDGWFRVSVPPGAYQLAGAGMMTSIRVVAGHVSRIANGRAIDEMPTLGLTLDANEIARLPLRRDASDVQRITPGVNQDLVGFSVYGSSSPENAFYMDGVHLNNTMFGALSVLMPIDFAQEVQVATAGYPAEFGHSTGGIVNVVTKNGFTPMRATAFAYSRPRGIQSASSHAGDLVPFLAFAALNKTSGNDFGVVGSGTLLRDKLYFAAGYDRLQSSIRNAVVSDFRSFAPTVAGPGTVFDRTTTQNAYMGKLEWRASDHLNLIGSVFGDPGHARGAVGSLNGEASTFMGTQDVGGNNASVNLLWTAANWLLNGSASTHREKSVDRPANESALVIDMTIPRSLAAGGFGGVTDERGSRDSVRFAAGHPFVAAGDHDVKVGGEYERSETDYRFRYTSGVFVRKRRSGSTIFYQKRFFVVPGSTLTNLTIASDIRTAPRDTYDALFAQDAWRLTDSLTANIGVRWERQYIKGDPVQQLTLPQPDLPVAYTSSFRTSNNWSPRLSLVWAPASSTRVSASYGRYFEHVPLDLAVRMFGAEVRGQTYNTNPNPTVVTPQQGLPRSSLITNYAEFVFGSIRGQHIDEVIVGADRALPSGMSAGAHLIQRKIGSVIEDFMCDPDGDYCIGNPERSQQFFIDPMTFDTTATSVKPRRDFRGAQIDLRGISTRSSWFASYLYSKLRGDYNGLFKFENGQFDPNLLSDFDLANFSVNHNGWLPQDRRHQVKIGGATSAFSNFGIGAVFTYASGTPLASLGADFFYGPGEHFLTQRGEALGRKRTPSLSSLDLRLSYALPVARYKVELLADAFNALNRQSATFFDENWTFDNIVSLPPGATAANAPNKNYQKPLGWQTPRQIRFGVRVTP